VKLATLHQGSIFGVIEEASWRARRVRFLPLLAAIANIDHCWNQKK